MTQAKAPRDQGAAVTSAALTAWERFRSKPRSERRIAFLLPADDVDGAERIVAFLAALAAAGWRVDDPPSDGQALTAALWRGVADEVLALPDYHLFLGGLPEDVRKAVCDRWGAPEGDPLFRPGEIDCGRFGIPAVRFGNAAVLAIPSLDRPPSHGRFAALAWLHDVFRADALIDVRCSDGGTPEIPWDTVLHLALMRLAGAA